MIAQAPRPVPAPHRGRLVSTLAALALVALLAAGCSLPSKKPAASGHECADKLVQELATNQTVKGLWACFDPGLQQSLNAYGLAGDDAFVSSGRGATPAGVVTIHYATSQNGVVIYTAVIKSDPSKPVETFVVVVWVDADGKISNVTIASGDL